jgi:hypothetical protein
MQETIKLNSTPRFLEVNLSFLSLMILQAVVMADGLTTALAQNLGGYELNSLYFPLLTAKILAFNLASFLALYWKAGLKTTFVIMVFSVVYSVATVSAVLTNIGVIGVLI